MMYSEFASGLNHVIKEQRPKLSKMSEITTSAFTSINTPPCLDRQYGVLRAYPNYYPEQVWFTGIGQMPEKSFGSKCMVKTVGNMSGTCPYSCQNVSNNIFSNSKLGTSNQYLYPYMYTSRPKNSLYSQVGVKSYKPFPYTDVSNDIRRPVPDYAGIKTVKSFNTICGFSTGGLTTC